MNHKKLMCIVGSIVCIAFLAWYVFWPHVTHAPFSWSSAPKVSWELAPTGSAGQVKTTVTLVTATGSRKEVGVFDGTCIEIGTNNLLQDEVSGVLCWEGDAGNELGVFAEGDGFVVKRVVVTSPAGGAYEGSYETLFSL